VARRGAAVADHRYRLTAGDDRALSCDVRHPLTCIAVSARCIEYVKRYNPFDGWNHAFWYSSDGEYYTLKSLGSDGQAEVPVLGPTTTFKADIIFSQGVFVQWPEGVQRQTD